MKYLELASKTVIELEIGEANIDLAKIFKKNVVKQIHDANHDHMGSKA